MATSLIPRNGLAALGAAGLLDIVQLSGFAQDDPPLFPILSSLVLGLLMVGGAAAAWRSGSRAGVWTAVIAGVLSVALGIPAFFLDAPAVALVIITVSIVLTVAGVWLVMPSLRRTHPGIA